MFRTTPVITEVAESALEYKVGTVQDFRDRVAESNRKTAEENERLLRERYQNQHKVAWTSTPVLASIRDLFPEKLRAPSIREVFVRTKAYLTGSGLEASTTNLQNRD